MTNSRHQQASREKAMRWRRTKIIATLGPASNSARGIEQLLRAGVDVFRLNMSHGDHDQHRKVFRRIRRASKKLGKAPAILMDLCGPKIRVGRFQNGEILLRPRQRVTVTTRACVGKDGLIPSQYRRLHRDARPGERILLDDGKLELRIDAVNGQELTCRVIYGGILKDHKGLNLPDSDLSVPALTTKDKQDAALAAELGADFLALSFVRCAKDIQQLARYLKRLGHDTPIIAKIEKPEAVENINEILGQAYAIMIARGDLGIELPDEKVPLIQKELIQLARHHQRPVIVATQMLESMITSSRPTRAEVGDVATAAASSTDAVMLSGETASGQYPLKSVQTMDRVLRETEYSQWQHRLFGTPLNPQQSRHPQQLRRAVADAVTTLADRLHLQGIIIPTRSGTTARIIAADRPIAPCMGVSSEPHIVRRMALHWGVVPVLIEEKETHDWHHLSSAIAEQHKLIRHSNIVLLVSGFHDDPKLNEPVMKLLNV